MKRYDLTLREDHHAELMRLTQMESGHEGAAVLFCRRAHVECDPWDRNERIRLLSIQVMPISHEDIVSSSRSHITYSTRPVVRALRKAQEEELTVAVVHSHREPVAEFSAQDDRDEPNLIELAQHRNGHTTEIASLVMLPNSSLFGRIWLSRVESVPLECVQVVGNRFRFFANPHMTTGVFEEAFSRQVLAFGPEVTAQLHNLRIGVVGCGATGSATVSLLVGHGVGKLLLVDADVVEESNISRMHGATMSDARARRKKVSVLEDFAHSSGLDVKVAVYPNWITDRECHDALKACDVIFGCTDDDEGRLLLNRFAYFYLVPVIDMGINIDPRRDASSDVLSVDGRVTVLQPGTRCLLCRDVIDPQKARDQQLWRTDHAEYQRQRTEGYIRWQHVSNPAVKFLTTDVACMAFDEFWQRLTGYRLRVADHRVRKFRLMEDKFPGVQPGRGCPICERNDYWGVGDMRPFLDRAG